MDIIFTFILISNFLLKVSCYIFINELFISNERLTVYVEIFNNDTINVNLKGHHVVFFDGLNDPAPSFEDLDLSGWQIKSRGTILFRFPMLKISDIGAVGLYLLYPKGR